MNQWIILHTPEGAILAMNLPEDRWKGKKIGDLLNDTQAVQGQSGMATLSWKPEFVSVSSTGSDVLANWKRIQDQYWLELTPDDSGAAAENFLKDLFSNDFPFRQVFETNQAIKWILDPDTGAIVYANEAASLFYGYSREELLNLKITDINILSEELVYEAVHSAALESRHYSLFKHRLKNGEIREMEVYTGPIRLNDKVLVFSILHDVTDRVEAVTKLEENEKKYRSIVENASDAIVITDRDAKLLEVNRRFEELLNYSKEELLSFTLETVLDSESWQETLKEMPNLIVGKPVTLQRKFKSKQGSLIDCEINAVLLDSDKAMGIVRDVTERNRITKELEKSLGEKQVLLQEIHHRVKNNLQVIASLLGLQYENYEDPTLRSALLESESRVKSMALVHSELYRSDNFTDVDLNNYFSSLSFTLIRMYEASQRIAFDLEILPSKVTVEKAIPLGLILNELLTNSVKYGFPGDRTGKIRIRLESDERGLVLKYDDNGVCYDRSFPEKSGSIGLQLIDILTRQLRAKSDFKTDNGIEFTLRIPE
ncbi:sensor histidine kinase [Leptospira fainei]|nr:PAS domain S-box protein [Leptospira fainei]